jgi:hypothetical protein
MDMTEPYQFSQSRIDDHIEKVGVDIRPVIEFKLDRTRLYTVWEQLVEAHPELFESLVQAPTDFRIMKRFIFPGKGEMELPTLAFTQRGPVFTFPRRLAALKEDTSLGRVDDIIMDCLKTFRGVFPEKKIIRVGLINEYIFDTAELDSARLVCERFTRLPVPVGGEIRLRINRRDDDHNRIIELEALQKVERVPEIPDRLQSVGYGVKVMVDFNNADMSQPLDDGRILRVLHEGRRYNDVDLYRFLNGDFGGE